MNMKKIILLLSIFSFLALNQSFAQNQHRCSTSDEAHEQLRERLVKNRKLYPNIGQLRNTTTWVPIKFHVFRDNGGTGGTKTADILSMLCALNEDYEDQDVQFYIHEGFNYIESSSVNGNPNFWNPIAQNIIMSNKVLNVVNVYITKDIPSSPQFPDFSSAGYYQPGFDFVVIKRDQANAANAETLTHELGHFFTLMHPFYGWLQEETYDINIHGNPAPATSTGGVPTELMDGSNCTVAGDMICDTPPSYNFGQNWAGCIYSGGVMDPNGVLVNPDETNYMDYFIGCATNFTTDQKTAILADIMDREIYTSGLDNTPINETANLIYPIGGESTPAWNWVGLDWEPVAGATGYIVEVDRKNSLFGNKPSIKFVYGGTYVEFEGIFDSNTEYDWRVIPINDGYYCAAPSSIGKFRTGESTSVNEIDEILNYSISPNPLSSNQQLNINIETTESINASISVFDMTGKRVRNVAQNFVTGITNFELSIQGLSQGMYILSIESETGVLNERIVVTQ